MLVKTEELEEGCILEQDVFSITNRPIIQKKTVLTKELIDVLKAFLIKEVRVEPYLVDGKRFNPSEKRKEVMEDRIEGNLEYFPELFLAAANKYKKEFNHWKSGGSVDVAVIREILLPLIDKAKPADLFTLHYYSTEMEYMYQHCVAVGILSAFIGKKLNYEKGDVVQLALVGALSDCGMAKIPDYILHKKAALTSGEYEMIKMHPTYSYKLIQGSPLIRESIKIAVLQHHERLDGSGYPLGKKGPNIHPFAKIIAVADTFHAMTSARIYRKKESPFKVLEMMEQDQFGKFDLKAIKALQSGLVIFSIGSKVKLSNGQLAEIIFTDEKNPTRPLVKEMETGEMINLQSHLDLYIDEVL